MDIKQSLEIEQGKLPHWLRIEDDGRFGFFLDNSALQNFARCDRLFAYSHIPDANGKVLHAKGGVPFTTSIGGWWSDCMSEFYEALAAKKLVNPGEFLLSGALAWLSNDMDRFANGMFAKAYDDFCGDGVAKFSFGKPMKIITKAGKELTNVTSITLPTGAKDMLEQYYNRYALEDAREWRIIATESGFGLKGELRLVEDSQVVVYLSGRPDLLIYENSSGRLPNVDHKTVDEINDQTVSRWKPHFQFIGYCLAADAISRAAGYEVHTHDFIVNLAARKVPTEKPRNGADKKPRFRRIRLSFEQSEVDEYKTATIIRARRLRYDIEQFGFDAMKWPMNDTQCSPRNGICEYRELDSRPASERLIALQSAYARVDPWKPYEVKMEVQ